MWRSAADPEHPLYGASITFTGELEGFTRDEARSACATLGATITAGPTKKADVVVIGGFDPATLRAGATVSSKLQKAMDLRAAGQHIELISEADLTALLAYEQDR
ncbi:BRCT domain-containing protein [Microbacterium sp. CJ77]|uniref:BRCT domain-containing protein n=1 Tax=Microbacterium sp. CJ77 TaxID=2079201 RepID=UPI000CD8C54C|nr:BRCT domain-containing protein [Microbacterium sp. CJ77]